MNHKSISLNIEGISEQIKPPGAFKSSDFQNLGAVVSGFLNIAFLIAGTLLLFWFVWGVFEYIFAGGEKDKLGAATSRIKWAIIGFILVVAAFSVSQYIQGIFPEAADFDKLKKITVPPNP